MSLLDIVIKGGWVMIPIGIGSILMLAIGIGRFLTLRRERDALTKFVADWELHRVDPSAYRTSCVLGPTLPKSLAELYDIERGGELVQMTEIETVARKELYTLETGLAWMATIAAVAPLLGFLGTVTGMVRAFMQIQNLGGAVNASVLAGGIWEALITTVAGLVVGIPALLFYNYLSSLIRDTAGLMEVCGAITMRQLGGRK